MFSRLIPPPLPLPPLGYNPYNAAPFCPHFWNCKILERKDHKYMFMHPCVKGKSCDQLNDPYHTRFWYHLNLPTCRFGASCLQLLDPWHRAHYHHPTPEGVPALRDYMLNCDHAEHCNITSSVHRLTFQHNRPFVFPEDGVAPPFIPDHTEKMCKVCFKRARECTCEKKSISSSGSNSGSSSPPQIDPWCQSSFTQSPLPPPPPAQNKSSLLVEDESPLTSTPTSTPSPTGKVLVIPKPPSPVSSFNKRKPSPIKIKWGYDFSRNQLRCNPNSVPSKIWAQVIPQGHNI